MSRKIFTVLTVLFSSFFYCGLAQENYEKIERLWKEQLRIGEEAYAEKNYEIALAAYDSALKIVPTDTLAYIQASVSAFNLGYYNRSQLYINDFSSLFKYTAKRLVEVSKGIEEITAEEAFIAKAESMFETAQSNMEAGAFDEALVIILEAEKLFPDQYTVFAKLELNIYIQQEEFEKLKSRMVALAKDLPNDLDINYNLGVMYEQEGNKEKAIQQYEKVVKIDPDIFEANYNAGVYYYNLGSEFLMEINGLDSIGYQERGVALEESALKMFLKAKPYFEACVLLNEEDEESYASLHATITYIENLKFNIETLKPKEEPLIAVDSVESVVGESQSVIPASDGLESGSEIIEGTSILVVSGLHFAYDGDAQFLKKGEKGYIKFKLENYGDGTSVLPIVNIIQPIATPGLNYQRRLDLENINPEGSKEVVIEVTYDEPLATRGFKKVVKTPESRMKLFIKDDSGANTGMLEFSLALNDDPIASTAAEVVKPKGKNYLLVMGCDAYTAWPKLQNAVKDAQDVKNLLLQKYSFSQENLYELYNEDFTAANIRKVVIDLKDKITPDDNLIIYYSGHGFYDEVFKEGYWIPYNGAEGETETYFSNNALHQFLKVLDTKHIFMVVDACFSGSLFSDGHRGASFASKVYQYKSRWGLSSGNLEFVSDGKPGENSPFCSYFLKYLRMNREPMFPVSELIQYVKISVAENTNQMPIGSPLKNLGHEGGEYVFHMK